MSVETTTFPFQITGEHITLGQLLKALDVVPSGGDAKSLLKDGAVEVNGQPDRQRGRKLRTGDRVTLPDGREVIIEE